MSPDVHGLSGAYAVDALDEAERLAFEHHLARCPACQAEVASLRAAAQELSALTETDPPSRLRDAVLGEIRNVRPRPPAPPDTAGRPGDGGPADDRTPRVVRMRRRLPVGWAAAAAAVIALVVGGVAWSPWSTRTPQLTAAEQVIHATDVQRYTQALGDATATLYRSPSLGRAVLVADHMPPTPPGRVYQLWLAQPDRGMVSAGLMSNADTSEVTVLLQGDAATATAAGITVEPSGGSPQPTTTPLALFSFT